VGGLLGGLLSRAGHRVICVAGAETARTLNQRGLQVHSRQFGEFVANLEAVTELTAPVDLCLVTVKQIALDTALDRIPPQTLRDALVLPLLNGIGHLDVLRHRYPAAQVIAGVMRVESARTAPGVIEHGSTFAQIDLGGDQQLLAPLADMLNAAGVETKIVASDSGVLWTKLAFLAPFALLTTYHRVPLGTIRTDHREELVALVEEAAAISRACGVATNPEKSLALYDAFPVTAKSSMQRDAEAGRTLELDAIGGALVRAAQQHGVSAPIATRLVADLASTYGNPH
jgi:2-dehydropantoate 2-reductase